IPLKVLLAPESYVAPKISPDGTKISYIAPLDGVMNYFVAPANDITTAIPVTHKTGRGIQAGDVSGNIMYRWSVDSKRIIFPADYDGDENWDIHVVNVDTGEEKNLTPMPGVKVMLVAMSTDHPDEILISITDRNPPLPDLYRLNIDTGERKLVEENTVFIGFFADHDLKPRLAAKLSKGGSFDLYKSKGDGKWEPFIHVSHEDRPGFLATLYQQTLNFDQSNKRLFMYDSRGRNTAALVSFNLETDELTVVAEDLRVDIGGVMYHPSKHKVQAYATNWTRKTWHVIDDDIAGDMAYLKTVADGDLDVVSRSAADDKWIVRYMLSDSPITYYLYDRSGKAAQKLFVGTPQLEGMALSKLHPVVIKSRDGFDLVSYVMLPPWTDPDEDGRPEAPVPMVVMVHGGPGDERAQYAFGPFLHWLANRGYALLYVNFRGSPGFGKAFMNAANLEWGGKMHEDILDQVEWAISEGITSRDRVGIMGGSYGGYETLVAMTMTPDVFACGVDLVGPANLEIPMPHWDPEMMSKNIGDPRTEAGRAFLKSRSPINFAHQTKNPLLIGQGATDSRVPQAQSDDMVKAMTANGAKVVYCLYPDEGHGLYRQENRYSFWAITEIFFSQCLGGRYLPLSDELVGSSIQVPEGASHIPGLKEALENR
ncbi:MAG: S9 family peptidase, partial [Deltaproteobacteria bacterium]|nr:S9 family peptidase [Deltaproteobacteria bacterium]